MSHHPDGARESVLCALRRGASPLTAAREASVPPSTVRRWATAWRASGELPQVVAQPSEPRRRRRPRRLPNSPRRLVATTLLLAAARCWAEGRGRHAGDDYARRPATTPEELDAARSDPRWGSYVEAVTRLERDTGDAHRIRCQAAAQKAEHVLRTAEATARVPYGVPASLREPTSPFTLGS